MKFSEIEKLRASKNLKHLWVKTPVALVMDSRIKASAFRTYLGVSFCIWKKWQTSQQFIAALTTVSPSQVRRDLRSLIDVGYLAIHKATAGLADSYSLTSPIYDRCVNCDGQHRIKAGLCLSCRKAPCLKCKAPTLFRSNRTGWCRACMSSGPHSRKPAQSA